MAVIDGDVVRGTGSFDLGRGSVMQAVFHWEYSGAGDTDDEVGDEIRDRLTNMYTNIEDRLDALTSSTQIEVWLYDTVLNQFDGIYQEDWLTITGTLVGQQLPNGAAALIRPLTNLPRRQGRKYISGLSSSQYLDAGWEAACVADLALMIVDIVATIATANGSLTPGVYNTADESFQAFKNAGIINNFAGYQRRRRPGVGI